MHWLVDTMPLWHRIALRQARITLPLPLCGFSFRYRIKAWSCFLLLRMFEPWFGNRVSPLALALVGKRSVRSLGRLSVVSRENLCLGSYQRSSESLRPVFRGQAPHIRPVPARHDALYSCHKPWIPKAGAHSIVDRSSPRPRVPRPSPRYRK